MQCFVVVMSILSTAIHENLHTKICSYLVRECERRYHCSSLVPRLPLEKPVNSLMVEVPGPLDHLEQCKKVYHCYQQCKLRSTSY